MCYRLIATPESGRRVRMMLNLMRSIAAVVGFLSVLMTSPAQSTERDPYQRVLFMKKHPCPSTGKTRGACPGYVVDHIKPLCAGGPDRPSNMQWQTVKEAKIKDRKERALCQGKRNSQDL